MKKKPKSLTKKEEIPMSKLEAEVAKFNPEFVAYVRSKGRKKHEKGL